jgi:hypothetical protein
MELLRAMVTPPPPAPAGGPDGEAPPPGSTDVRPAPAGGRPPVRTTLIRVLVVQAVTLALLGLLQWGFGA